MTMPFAKVQARRERMKQNGTYYEPPFGFLADTGLTMSAWLDALSVGRATSLVETWRLSQQTLSPNERWERAAKARHDLYRDP